MKTTSTDAPTAKTSDAASNWTAAALLAAMFLLAGGAALRESVTVDEFAHVGAGLSYWQRLDMRLNGEHPPLGKPYRWQSAERAPITLAQLGGPRAISSMPTGRNLFSAMRFWGGGMTGAPRCCGPDSPCCF